MEKPFSPSCERNKDPILEKLKQVFSDVDFVWEIGSGSGQHAAYFTQSLDLTWQPSDVREMLSGIRCWVEEVKSERLREPIEFNVNQLEWPINNVSAIFSSNTLHIISFPEVEKFFRGVGRCLVDGGALVIYGPFNYGGKYTSPGNESLDRWLKSEDSCSGIRDFESINGLALKNALELVEDFAMPANNRLLVWKKAGLSSER